MQCTVRSSVVPLAETLPDVRERHPPRHILAARRLKELIIVANSDTAILRRKGASHVDFPITESQPTPRFTGARGLLHGKPAQPSPSTACRNSSTRCSQCACTSSCQKSDANEGQSIIPPAHIASKNWSIAQTHPSRPIRFHTEGGSGWTSVCRQEARSNSSPEVSC